MFIFQRYFFNLVAKGIRGDDVEAKGPIEFQVNITFETITARQVLDS